jgi:acyl-CoA dehydrogenase
MTSAPLEAFRAETRAWLEASAPEALRNRPDGELLSCRGGRKWVFQSLAQRLWLERMGEKGWTAPEWPKAYGGGGLTPEEAQVLRKEMQRIKVAPPLESLGIWMLGPALLRYGTEEQKRTHLPPIVRGEIAWAQGYSEPGAGSDLASLQTRAIDDGDHFIVNGSKIWTSFGDQSDWIFALVRSEPEAPKHLGITFLLIDMTDPGVSTRPIKLIAGDSPFTQTFFDNVRAPKANIVGERGRGWDVAKYLLQFERQMIGSSPTARKEGVANLALQTLGREGLAREQALRADILQFELDAWVQAIALERSRDLAAAGTLPATLSSLLKVSGSELKKRRVELTMSLVGADALDAESRQAFDWLYWPASTIAGGSNEIQLNVLAKRALGLPGA